jgi:HlyD family secretion protein
LDLTKFMGERQNEKSLKVGLRWLIGSSLLAIICLGGGVFYALVSNRPDPVPVRLLKAKRDMVETTLNESGTVELGGQQTLKSPAQGAIDRVLVQPGDRVTQGQILLTLQNPDRQTAIADQQLKIEQQEVALLRSRQQMAEAQEQLAVDRRRRENLAALAQDGAIPQSDVQDLEDQIRTAIAALHTAEADMHTAALQLQVLRLEQQRIQEQLQNTIITAPLFGMILGINVKSGDGVEFRTDLLTLGNPDQELIQLQLSTLNAAQVRVRQLARVSVIGANPKIYRGRIQGLYPQAIAPSLVEGASPQQSQQAIVPTTVQLDTPTRTLIPGSQVNVEIVLEQRQNVVTLDIEAVQDAQDAPFVWVMEDGNRVAKRSIALGLEGLTTVEVKSGLRPDETVVVPLPNQSLQPGTLVSPQSVSPQSELGGQNR